MRNLKIHPKFKEKLKTQRVLRKMAKLDRMNTRFQRGTVEITLDLFKGLLSFLFVSIFSSCIYSLSKFIIYLILYKKVASNLKFTCYFLKLYSFLISYIISSISSLKFFNFTFMFFSFRLITNFYCKYFSSCIFFYKFHGILFFFYLF